MLNEAKMTLEEKIVQRLKNDTLMAVIGDEDALLELTKRAIQEALFQPQKRDSGYGRTENIDSIVVAAARKVAQKAIEKVTDQCTEELMANPEFKTKFGEFIAQAIPTIILERFDRNITDNFRRGMMDNHETLRAMAKSVMEGR